MIAETMRGSVNQTPHEPEGQSFVQQHEISLASEKQPEYTEEHDAPEIRVVFNENLPDLPDTSEPEKEPQLQEQAQNYASNLIESAISDIQLGDDIGN